jgi:hypothetical protein
VQSLNSHINGYEYFGSAETLFMPHKKAKIEQLSSVPIGYLASKKDNSSRKAKIGKE